MSTRTAAAAMIAAAMFVITVGVTMDHHANVNDRLSILEQPAPTAPTVVPSRAPWVHPDARLGAQVRSLEERMDLVERLEIEQLDLDQHQNDAIRLLAGIIQGEDPPE